MKATGGRSGFHRGVVVQAGGEVVWCSQGWIRGSPGGLRPGKWRFRLSNTIRMTADKGATTMSMVQRVDLGRSSRS